MFIISLHLLNGNYAKLVFLFAHWQTLEKRAQEVQLPAPGPMAPKYQQRTRHELVEFTTHTLPRSGNDLANEDQ